MPTNTYAPNKGNLIEPPYSSFPDSWDQPVNSNFGMISALAGGVTEIDATTFTGSAPTKTLVFRNYEQDPEPWTVPLAGQNLCLNVVGLLSTNATILIPKDAKGSWIVYNGTTGSFTLGVKTTAGSSVGVILPQGYSSVIYCDGTNVRYADQGNVIANFPPQDVVLAGMIVPYAGTASPSGYLPCDGAAVSRTTYAKLYAVIGTVWGTGDGSTTFNVPDLRDMFIRGAGASSGVGVFEANTFKSHNHNLTDPGHTHRYTRTDQNVQGVGYFPGGPVATANPVADQVTSSATTGITIDDTGDAETRPDNKRVLFIIKT